MAQPIKSTLFTFWVSLTLLTTEAVQEGHSEGRRTSRSFVPLGRLSFGVKNDITSSGCQSSSTSTENGGILRGDEFTQLWSSETYHHSMSCGFDYGEPSFANRKTVLAAAVKTKKRLNGISPFKRRTQQQQSAAAETVDKDEVVEGGLDKASLLAGAAEPIMPKEVWEKLKGDEYDDPDVVEKLALAALKVASRHSDNGWVEWKGGIPTDLDKKLDDGGIEVFTGSALRKGYGSEVPWIKSISILPFSPSEMADLMMDSTRVRTYNSLSLGREDLKVMPSLPDYADQATKIVRNVVQLPVSNSKIESVTLLHTRKLGNGAHLLVSRAIGGTKYYDEKIGTGYTLLGVNLFEPIPGTPDECRLTAISHVYSPGVPLMLAGKVGVKSARNFVKDIRSLCVPAP